jgi:hypothetical protein
MITQLKPNEVFVFGSNLAGLHGGGAARQAYESFGAVWGDGEGPTGQCYAIPTKDRKVRTLPLSSIERSVQHFLRYAAIQTEQTFLVTAIGCGLAGYNAKQIAPMFVGAGPNVILPEEFTSV